MNNVAEKQTLRGRRFHVLDDGFVELVDVMGNDRAIAQAAWISTDAERPAEDRSAAAVRRVIRYMMYHRHTTPFEMVELKFRVRIPMDAWRQGVRHRTFNVNEYSTRYSEAINSMASTEADRWRPQATSNMQGSDEGFLPFEVGEHLSARERALQRFAREVYEERLAAGVAREHARKDLPLSTYTELYWKNDLHNLFHFLQLRLDAHAQWEIRQYARAIAEIVQALFPVAWEAFVDYRLEGTTLSRMELQAVRDLLRGTEWDDAAVDDAARDAGIDNAREVRAFMDKIRGMV